MVREEIKCTKEMRFNVGLRLQVERQVLLLALPLTCYVTRTPGPGLRINCRKYCPTHMPGPLLGDHLYTLV